MMNVSGVCTQLETPFPSIVGPKEVYSSIGHWNTAVYVILVLHLLPVWIAGTISLHHISTSFPPSLVAPSAWLVTIPPALMSLTSMAILVPSLGNYIEVLLEIVISIGLLKFIRLSVILCGGSESIITYCNKRNIRLPIGSPPFVCFLPCQKPPVNSLNFKLMVSAPVLLLVVKIGILVNELVFAVGGYNPSGNFFALDNLHNLIAFPVGLVAIYSYTMFNFIMNDCLTGNNKRFLGIVLLVEFILFDCLRLFFIFLTGTGMLTCVPPFLTTNIVVDLLKNYIKAFLATGLGLPFIKLCAEKTESNQSQTCHMNSSQPSMSSLVSDESSRPSDGDRLS